MSKDSESNNRFGRRSVLAAGGAMTLGTLVGAVGAAANGSTVTQQDESDGTSDTGRDVTVRQEPGYAFYWVLPGERRLSPQVFGTPENPRRGSEFFSCESNRPKGCRNRSTKPSRSSCKTSRRS